MVCGQVSVHVHCTCISATFELSIYTSRTHAHVHTQTEVVIYEDTQLILSASLSPLPSFGLIPLLAKP